MITHNLGIVARYAERIYVMYAGNIVEAGTTMEIFHEPSHPYTRGLLRAVPRLDDDKNRLIPIDGNPPTPTKQERRLSVLSTGADMHVRNVMEKLCRL